MTITSIRLQNYRSYRDKKFNFGSGINILSGPNACGKTNLLEAIFVSTQGSSFRSKDEELVRHKSKWARVDAVFNNDNRSLKLVVDGDQISKEFTVNGKAYKRLSYERRAPIVLFEPNHILFLTKGPDKRRDFVDSLLLSCVPGMATTVNRYKKTLAQRNALLKQTRGNVLPQIFVWDIRLAEIGQQIAVARQDIIDQLNQEVSLIYSSIAGKKTKLLINYQSQFEVSQYASKMVSRLKSRLEDDMQRGFTSTGPHREDFEFVLNGQNMNDVASRGEARSIMLAVKIFETQLMERIRQEKPIILLDDVFSELDINRRKYLIEVIKNFQCLITTTDGDHLRGYLGKNKFKALEIG